MLDQLYAGPLECFPDRAAIVFEDGGVTYRQLGENVRRHAAALASLGVGRGDRVGLFVGNRPELIELYLACFRVGAVALPLNTRFQIPEVVQACEQSTPRIMIADPERLPRVADLRASLAPAWSFA